MVYIASPYSHKSKVIQEHRRLQIERIGAKLEEKYSYAFIHPITTSARLSDKNKNLGGSFANWARKDLTFISRCDELWVIMIPGWKESIGVQAEIAFAKYEKYIKIRYMNPKTLKFVKLKENKIEKDITIT
jgi:hypothetical protein